MHNIVAKMSLKMVTIGAATSRKLNDSFVGAKKGRKKTILYKILKGEERVARCKGFLPSPI